jgi:hypothetical protein
MYTVSAGFIFVVGVVAGIVIGVAGLSAVAIAVNKK